METSLTKHEQLLIQYEDLGYNDDWLYTYEGELFTGTAYVYDGENEEELVVLSEIPFEKGQKSGLCRSWYRSGQLQRESSMKDGAGHGLAREWYENGHLKRERLGEWSIPLYIKEWDEQGNLTKDYKLKKTDRDYQSLLQSRRIWGHEIDWEPEE